jgi:predicted ATPase/class 3 adenylate cyclase
MIMHRLVPYFIQDHYAAGKYNGAFPAVGLFLDISGFSSMTDALMGHGHHGAEVLASIMRAVMDPLIEGVFEQSGFVATSAGDALTALFPIDSDKTEACLRALAAAWKIQQRMATSADFRTPYQTFRISAKIGLAMGDVHWGILTSTEGQRGVYYFQGTAVDGCAEAEHQAQANNVIIDAQIRALLQEKVIAEPTGEHFRILQITGELPKCLPITLPPADPKIMGHFYPQNLFSQAFSGEFRQVVNLFISLPSVRTEAQLKIFVESMFFLQEKYGGMLSRLDFGDKGTNLLLFWGVPAAYENDIERAVNFILDLQTVTSIPISAGMTYRISHAGFIGSELYEEYACSGRGVNLAARFMTASPRGEIWIDEMIAARVSHRYEVEFISETFFKGFHQPQKVYVLLERKEKPAEFFTSAMIGRQEELGQLLFRLQPLFENKFTGLFVISGEPGIGKSRLLHEVQHEMLDQHDGQVQIFLGQMDEIQRQPFNPFQYWLRQYFGVSSSQGEARNKRNFNRKLDELISITDDQRLSNELDRTRSFLGALVGLEWPDSLYELLDAEGRYNNTLIALAILLQAESLRLPVIFILEDIDWLDDASKAFLPYLLRACAAQEDISFPIAVLSTSRYQGCELGIEGLPCSELHLEGLDRPSLNALAQTELDAPPSESLLDLLQERAEGNPFYAEQILHFMRDERWLVFQDNAWDIKPGQVDALPTDVNILLVARLDHLAGEVKDVIQTASVLGREFEIGLLTRMLLVDTPSRLNSAVSIAEQEAIWSALTELRYIFKHVLMRDAAYQMLVHTRRKELHGLAVQAYESLYAASLDNHYSELAYHAEQAGLAKKASEYLKLAGYAARDSFQNSLAANYFSRALDLTPENDIDERYKLLMARVLAYHRQGSRAAQQHDLLVLEEMLPALNQVSHHIEIALRQSEFTIETGAFSESVQFATQAKDLALQANMPLQAASASLMLASCALKQGKLDEATDIAKQGLVLAQEAASLESAVESDDNSTTAKIEQNRLYNVLGLISVDQGNLDTAHSYLSQSLELSRQDGNPHFLATALNNIGIVAERQRNDQAAWDYYAQALEITRKTGERQGEGIALMNMGFNAKKRGNYRIARSYLEQSLRIVREVGAPYYEAYTLINLSACLGALGDHAKATDLARHALNLAKQLGDPSGEAWALTYLGNSQLAMAEYSEALSAYTKAIAIREKLHQFELACEPAAGAARTALENGDLPGARQYIEPVLTYLNDGGTLDTADEPLRVYYTCYLILEQSGDPRSKEMLQVAYNSLQEQAAQIPAESVRREFLENIEQHRQILLAWEKEQARA